MDLKNVLAAYLSPDKDTSLKSALAGVDDLNVLLEEAKKESDELVASRKDGTFTQEDKDHLVAITQVMKAAVAERQVQIEQAQTAAEVNALNKELKSLTVPELPKAEVKKTEEPKSAPVVEQPKAEVKPEPVQEPVPVEPVAAQAESVKELVGAGAPATFSVSQIPVKPVGPAVVANPDKYSNVFGVSANGVLTGQKIEGPAELLSQVRDVFRSYSRQGRPGNGVMHRVASFQRDDSGDFGVDGVNGMEDQAATDRLAMLQPQWDESRGQFAAGWCAPAETEYELCPQISSDTAGIVDMPSQVARRGSVQTSKAPRFSTLYADAAVGQILTEAQVEAETVKNCIEIDCPDFTTLTLKVNPLCVTGNLLTRAGYPEYENRFISEVVTANLHKINADILTTMAAASTAINLGSATLGAVDTSSMSKFLDAASKYATWLRGSERTDQTKIVRVEAPYWLWQQMESDVSRRTGVDLLAARRRFNEAAAERGLDIRFVYDWQMLNADPANLAVINGPQTATVLVYFPGTWAKYTNPVINLGVLHSAAQLSLNQYTAMFVEDGYAVTERCWDSLAVTFPTCPSGTTGAASGSCDVTP